MPRTCTICRHPERRDIDADLKAGMPYRAIAQRYSISKDAVSRHRASHVSLYTTPLLATVTKIRGLLDDAETSANFSVCLRMVQEARHCVEELAMQLERGIAR